MTGVKYINNGEQAFTEDNILIFNLYAYQLPHDVTALKIREHFKQFGEVLNVHLLGKSKTKKCFIYFADSKAAAKALIENYRIYFMGWPIEVEPCHGFRQPDGAPISDLLNRACKRGSIETYQEALILTLNDDCLEKICKQLPLIDQINFALTCVRFYNVVVMCSKVEHAYLNTDIFAEWTMWRTIIFIQIVGPQVKKLEMRRVSENSVYNFLASFCTNVEKLKVIADDKGRELTSNFIKKMPLLQELELDSVTFGNNLVHYLKAFKNLKSLSIKYNVNITGEYIHFLNGLEKLSLVQCTRIASKHFKKICTNLKNLHYLNVQECYSLDKDDYEHVSKHLLQLKTLKLSGFYEKFNCIAKSPKIKQLEIRENRKNTSAAAEFFKNLPLYQANQLEVLKLSLCHMNLKIASFVAELRNLKVLHCTYGALNDKMLIIFSRLTELEEISLVYSCLLSDKSVLKLLENCLKLKHLDLRYCYGFTPKILSNALILLQDQRARSLRTFTVHMDFSHYYNDIVNAVSAVDNCADILKINVEYGAIDRCIEMANSYNAPHSDNSSDSDDSSLSDDSFDSDL